LSCEAKKVGKTRYLLLKIVRILSKLKIPNFQKLLIETGLLKTLCEFIFHYPNNNIAHSELFGILSDLLDSSEI